DFPIHERESLEETRQELRTLAQQSATSKAHRDALVLRAPCDGIVMGFPSWEMQGKWLPEGTPLCQVGDIDKLRVLVLLEPADRQLLTDVGQAFQPDTKRGARFHGHGAGSATWEGKVAGVAQVDADEIPP